MAIRKQGNGYGVRVWQPARSGERGRHVWLGTFDKLADARKADAAARSKPTARGSLTVADWGEQWLANYPRDAAYTRRTYAYAVRQIVDKAGSRKLADITRPEARKLANEWARNTSRVARTMWGDALREGLCNDNPFSNLRLETPRGRKDITALTEPEIFRLAEMARKYHGDYGDEAAAIILFAAYTGLRPGELAALRWSDLDVPTRRATIRFALDGQGGVKAPKNGKPRRIVLAPQALRALEMVARPLLDDQPVFRTSRGRRLSKGTLAYLWRPVAAAWRAQGGRDLDLYELRHACATMLLERGSSPADVAVQLGHTDGGRLVCELYGHPDEDRARDRLEMALSFDGQSETASGGRDGHRTANAEGRIA